MGSVVLHFSMSLDGYVAGPAANAECPMGQGGERLHEWLFSANKSATDIECAREMRAAAGAVVLGKRTFDVGIGPWGDTPYAVPCFVLTHADRDDLIPQMRDQRRFDYPDALQFPLLGVPSFEQTASTSQQHGNQLQIDSLHQPGP